MIRRLFILLGLAISIASCKPASLPKTENDLPVILASTTVLADITRNIAGDRFQVESILPVGADPHSYQPTPKDVAKMSETNFVIINGANYENFLQPLFVNSGGEEMLVEASKGITPRKD